MPANKSLGNHFVDYTGGRGAETVEEVKLKRGGSGKKERKRNHPQKRIKKKEM